MSVSLVLALVVAEIILRSVVHSGDYLQVDPVDDLILGHRVEPGASGHDSLGFRNLEVPSSAGIVTIGDSQTYGVSAILRESWPYKLGEILDTTVYQMALGGYAPLEYLHLLESDAKILNPHTVLVGLYFGNDIMGAARTAHQRDHWSSWRINEIEIPKPPELKHEAKRFDWIRDRLSKQSVIYNMLRVNVGPLLHFTEGRERFSISSPNEYWVWNDPELTKARTIFTPKLRLFALDTSNPAINEGIAITKRVIQRIGAIGEENNWNIYIILIPTKEFVYCDLVKVRSDFPKDFERLCEAESNIRSNLLQQMHLEEIEVIDTMPALQAEAKAHVQIYPQNDDGHPNGYGYSVIAHVIADRLTNDQVVQ